MQRVKNIINKINNEAGFTLVEILVALFILAIIITALASSFVLATRITDENRLEMMAVSLANEAVEEIRSLEFSEIGTLGGDPAGDIPQYRVENINGVEFDIYTMINWEEQEDGFIGGNLSWDYKSIRVTVAPRNLGGIAKTIETLATRESAQPPITGGNIKAYLVRGWNTENPPENIPVSNVKVSLGGGPIPPRVVYSSARGTASFVDLPNGNYQVTADPSALGMIVYPGAGPKWQLNVEEGTTYTDKFELEYPCRLYIAFKNTDGEPLVMNGKVTITAPFVDPESPVGNPEPLIYEIPFTAADLDENGNLRMPVEGLWPVGEGFVGSYSVDVESDYTYKGCYDLSAGEDDEWDGTFDAPGTFKSVVCYFE
jgi:prepilin-type N-terminal cleavage/methylation domain-containing protein